MAKPAPSLLDNAVAAVQNVHALTVGLAHAGADPHAIQQLSQCSALLTQIVKALGNGPAIDSSGGAQPGGPPQGQPAGPPPGQPTGPPPGPPQAAAPAGPPQAAPAGGHGGPMLAAAKVLQAAHAAANAK